MEHVDHSKVIIDSIDAALEAPPFTIEQALDWAVQHGHMSIKECEEFLNEYIKVFGQEKPPT